jgi:hypothetical protein
MFFKSKKMHKPIRAIVKREIQRRAPGKKGYNNYSITQLLNILQTDEMILPDKDMIYVQSFLEEYRGTCQLAIDDNNVMEVTNDSSRISTEDRLRLIEAFFCDEAKSKLASTQECLNRPQLDSRNSEVAVVDYFQTVSDVFNNPSFVPMLQRLPEVHPLLEDSRELPLKNYTTTRSKVKEKYDEMRNQLHSMETIEGTQSTKREN